MWCVSSGRGAGLYRRGRRSVDARRQLRRTRQDGVDQAVLARLLGGEPAVTVGVGLDLLDGLAGVEGDPLLHETLGVEHLLGLDRDVARRTADAARGLVHHDARVRKGVTLARRAGAEDE